MIELPTPTYHQALREHLEQREPEMWAWFSEMAFPSTEAIQQAELDLLKTSYRLEQELHGALIGAATLMAGQLDLDLGITLYQELGLSERNARVMKLGNHIHVIFGGDLLNFLTFEEQQSVLAHELAHIALWEREGRAYQVLNDMVHRMDAEPLAPDEVSETARRLRIHTEVWADAVALTITNDRAASISSIVKVVSGLQNVDPDAYLRQAQQILSADASSSEGWTHPELHVRVACMAARDAADPGEIIRSLIEGPDDLDRIDLLGQVRLRTLTQRVLASASSIAPERSERIEAEAYRQSFRSLDPRDHERVRSPATEPTDEFTAPRPADAVEPLADGELADAAPSVRYYCAALLVDLALIGDGAASNLGEARAHSSEAERLGIDAEFDKILRRATSRTAAEIRKLRAAS